MNTRKTIATMAALMFSAAMVHANVYITWAASGGFYYNNDDPLMTPGSGESVLAQLIWSSDSTADDAVAGVSHYVSGDDEWMADFVLTEGDNTDEWGVFYPPNYSSSEFSGGYVYARVFTTETPEEDDWYYVGPVVAAQEIDGTTEPKPTAQPYNVNRNWDPVGGDGAGLGDIVDSGPYAYQVQPVPEPGTMALMALGVATLAMRRRRKA